MCTTDLFPFILDEMERSMYLQKYCLPKRQVGCLTDYVGMVPITCNPPPLTTRRAPNNYRGTIPQIQANFLNHIEIGEVRPEVKTLSQFVGPYYSTVDCVTQSYTRMCVLRYVQEICVRVLHAKIHI